MNLLPNKDYQTLLHGPKERITQARQQAAITVNTQLLFAYWEIGNEILKHQKKEGWGAKIIQQLSADLRAAFPDMKGLSVRNMHYMRAFAEAWSQFQILQSTVAELQSVDNITIKQLCKYSP